MMPRAAVEFDADKTLLLTFAWGQYVQYPQGPEIVDVWGNPDLDFLRSEHFTVGVDKKLNDGWRIKTEAYFKTFEDLPVPHVTLNYVNEGSGEAWGTELLVKKEANGSPFSGWVSVAYAKTERTNDLTGENFYTSYDQPWIANLVPDTKVILNGYSPADGATRQGRHTHRLPVHTPQKTAHKTDIRRDQFGQASRLSPARPARRARVSV